MFILQGSLNGFSFFPTSLQFLRNEQISRAKSLFERQLEKKQTLF